MTEFVTSSRSPLTLSLIAAVADTPPDPLARSLKGMGEVIGALMESVCRPYESFGAAIDGAVTLFACYRAVMTGLHGTGHDPFAMGDPTLERGLIFDGRLLAGVLREDADLRRAIAAPGYLSALDPFTPFGELWALLHDRYAHRALDAIDLAAPRFGSDALAFARLLLKMGEQPIAPLPRRSRWRRMIRRPDRRPMLDGYFRHSASFCLAHLRHELLYLSDKGVTQGALANRAAIWSLPCDAVRTLDG